MSYILKHKDTELMCFDLVKDIDGVRAVILSMDEKQKSLLPLDMEQNEKSLVRWLKNRTIPQNRAYVSNFLAKLGLNEKDTIGILDLCHGLSLNDCYWVVPDGYKASFDEKNLYDNHISRTLAEIAFTGYGSYNKSSLRSSPEFTTNGMLAKAWRRIGGEITLYKSGTEGFANSGNEPYSEFYAFQIAETMGLRAIPYGLSQWKGKLCSTCRLFTSKEISFVAAGRIVREGGITAVMDYYKSLSGNYYNDLLNMLLFDAIVFNEDRHFGNFGLLVNANNNTIIDTAPVFDNGLSLFCYAMQNDLEDIEQYAKTRRPSVYDDFVEFSKKFITSEQKQMLRKLIGFRFKKHSRYNLAPDRLKAIEAIVQIRVRELLG